MATADRAAAADRAGARDPLIGRLTVSQWFAIAAIALGLVTIVSAVIGSLAISHVGHERRLVVDAIGPARTASIQLSTGLLEQETGVRGFALTGHEASLAPYALGRREEQAAITTLRQLTNVAEGAAARHQIPLIEARAGAWRRTYAEPTIAAVRRGGPGARADIGVDAGRQLFDQIRVPLDRQVALLAQARAAAKARLDRASNQLTVVFAVIIVLLALGIGGVVVALRRTVSVPLRRVARQVRRTAQGEYDERIGGDGPRDVAELSADIDAMRRQIVQELQSLQETHGKLDAQTRELQRSNAELEQFAYVASHDLQEPLRKVASFCQLIEKRYAGQLDERGEQYIAFAVDGAKRMQQLINDLLAFSRVGRAATEHTIVELDEVAQQALTSLAAAIEETGAEIVIGELPQVRGEASLLAGVFQNLIGNALKFRGEERPRVVVSAERDGDSWRFAVTDDGIGIEPGYAERIFMIFQRLHAKDRYPGTGIGLAMVRKVVEYHGGTIWLDTATTSGTTFRFILPALPADQESE
ncbi:MAG: multi-sensor signal transduction histidine kinase [Conexibacter sp.]|nr:multi-sensor signal transduction histidine kinase [Conexibacter sp.]